MVFFLSLSLSGASFAKTITLTYIDQNPELSWGSTHATQPWIKRIEEATQGRFEIPTYDSQTLPQGKDAWRAVKNGLAGHRPMFPRLPVEHDTPGKGAQFAGKAFTDLLKDNSVRISMDGRRRVKDNIFIKRLWWFLKYQYLYLGPSTTERSWSGSSAAVPNVSQRAVSPGS